MPNNPKLDRHTVEVCARVAEQFKDYTGAGREDKNDLIGMFGRGNQNARASIAAALRALVDEEGPITDKYEGWCALAKQMPCPRCGADRGRPCRGEGSHGVNVRPHKERLLVKNPAAHAAAAPSLQFETFTISSTPSPPPQDEGEIEALNYLTEHFIVKDGPNNDKNQYGHLELWWGAKSVHEEPSALYNPWMLLGTAESSYSLAAMGELQTVLAALRRLTQAQNAGSREEGK